MHNRNKYLNAISGAVLMACFSTGSAFAAIYTVTKAADTNDGICNADCSLREAVIAANANPGPDSINLPSGTYKLTLVGANEDYSATGDLDIRGDLSINGVVRTIYPIIDGNLQDRVFDIIEGVKVELTTLVVMNGVTTSDSGAGIYNRGNTTVNNLVFYGNVASGYGGAIESRSNTAQLSILSSLFSRNCSSSGGAVESAGWQLTIDNSRFDTNVPVLKGGINCLNGDGAALHLQGGEATINKSTFINNVGAVGAISSYFGMLDIINTTITNNRGLSGGHGGAGGIMNQMYGWITVKNSTIAYNRASTSGGGVGVGDYGANPVILINSIVANNTAPTGADCSGAVASDGNNMFSTVAGCGVVLHASDTVGNPMLGSLVTTTPLSLGKAICPCWPPARRSTPRTAQRARPRTSVANPGRLMEMATVLLFAIKALMRSDLASLFLKTFFGQGYVNELRRRQPRRGDKWRPNEVAITIKGK